MEQTKQTQLTQRQTDILLLLYRFRFLTRPQIQKLLHHKHHRQVIQWLNELTEHHYVRKYYDKKSAVIPAMYSLGRNSRTVLKKAGKQASQLKRIQWEENYSKAFREKCIQIADLYLLLTDQTGGALRFWTKIDLQDIENLIEPAPDAYLIVEAKRYFLDTFTVAPGKILRGRLHQYADYFAGGEWQEQTKAEFPDVIIFCPNEIAARRLNRYIAAEFADEPDLHFVASSDRTLEFLQPKKKA
jgi:hypothetical protein